MRFRIFNYLLFGFESALVAVFYKVPLGDTALIVDGGARILRGINPYTNYDFGNLASAGVIFDVLSKLTGINALSKVIVILNVFGILAFTSAVSKIYERPVNSLILLIPATISFRALVADGQITGIVLLLLSVPLLLGRERRLYLPLSIISLSVACELKIHMALPFCIVAMVISKRKSILAGVAMVLTFTHVLVGIVFGFNLDNGWLHSISRRSSGSLEKGAEFSMWKVFNHLIEAPALFRIASILAYLAALVVIGIGLHSTKSALVLATTAPIFLTYQHAYDWIPLIVCGLFVWTVKDRYKICSFLILISTQVFLPSNLEDILLSVFSLIFASFGIFLLIQEEKISIGAVGWSRLKKA